MIKKTIIIITLVLLCACQQTESQLPDVTTDSAETKTPELKQTLIYNAQIYTVDKNFSLAQSMVFNSAGEIEFVGTQALAIQQYPDAARVDLEGKTVLPGLIDSHAHLYGLALSLTQAQLRGTESKADVLRVLREHEKNLQPGEWLLGRGWDQNDWPVMVFPSRTDLDEAFPDRPVWLRRIDGHAGWANSVALAKADQVLSGNWQPQGGKIYRDDKQQATGLLVDSAMALVSKTVPAVSAELMDLSMDLAFQKLLSRGLTGVHDPGINQSVVKMYQQRIQAGTFPTRVYAMTDGAGKTLDWLCKRGALNDDSGRLIMRAVKLYIDGALGSRGAALLADYNDDPGNKGLLFMPPADLQAKVDKALACGFQVGIHAIGDRGNRVALDALQAGIEKYPDNPGRHRIEHAQVLTASDIPRFAELGIIAAMQPTHATSDMYWAEARLGPERIKYAYAWRRLLDSGARLALGSDFPVEKVNPMQGIYAAVSRKDLKATPVGGWYPDQVLSRSEALRGFTLDAAYAGFMEDQVGSLQVGKRADFIVLDRDLMQIETDEIPKVKVLQTWLDGVRVWQHPSQAL